MDSCDQERMKSESGLKKLESDKDMLLTKRNELRDLEIKQTQSKRQYSNSTEKLNRLAKHQESKQSSNQVKLTQLKQEYENHVKERAVAQSKADENEKTILSIETKVFLVFFINDI